jgi:hypothetical protein
MVTVEIDGAQATLEEAVAGGWITEQLRRRRDDDRNPCVRVDISAPGVHLALKTPTCVSRPNGDRSRRANQEEQEILDLWSHHKLDQTDFSSGDLQAFLRRLSQML